MSITLDYLMISLEREGLLPSDEKDVTLLFFSNVSASKAFSEAEKLRESGCHVRMVRDDDGSLFEKYQVLNQDSSGNITFRLESFDVADVTRK